MTSQPDLLSAFVQQAYQKINIQELFNNPDPLYHALMEGMPMFKWEVTTGIGNGTVHISATLNNVKESWTITLSLTKGRAVSRSLDKDSTPSRLGTGAMGYYDLDSDSNTSVSRGRSSSLYTRDSDDDYDRRTKPLGPLDPDPRK